MNNPTPKVSLTLGWAFGAGRGLTAEVSIGLNAPDPFLQKHADYVASCDHRTMTVNMWVHLRMSGTCWGLAGMALIGLLHLMSREEILAFSKSCQHELDVTLIWVLLVMSKFLLCVIVLLLPV